MQGVRRYVTEGVVQMSILLSLCALSADAALKSYLPTSWHHVLLGPTSGPTQMHTHHLCKRLALKKSAHLDGFFTAGRLLLGWVPSLDTSQIHTRLGQQEPGSEPQQWRDATDVHAHAGSSLDDTTAAPEEDEDEQEASSSFQECLKLLEETFPFTKDQQLCNDGGRGVNLEQQPPARELLLSPMMPTCNSSLEAELQWQDVLAVIQPDDNLDEMDEPPVLPPNSNHVRAKNPKEMHLQHKQGLERPPTHFRAECPRLPLTCIADLDDCGSAFRAEEISFEMFTQRTSPNAGLTEEPSEGVRVGLNAMKSTVSTHLLTEHLEKWQSSPSLWCWEHDGNIPGQTPSSERHFINQDILCSPSNGFLGEDEDEDVLPSPLGDILQDAAIMEQMTLFAMAMEETFSPEMAAGVENTSLGQEAGHLGHGSAVRKEGGDAAAKEQGEPKNDLQDSDNEADSDSGLSLDFSHGLSSPSTSESSYSSSSGASTVRSPSSEDREEEDELLASRMEVGVTIKQEDLQVEEMGEEHFLPVSWDHQCFSSLSWLENILHDHSYNKPWSRTPSPFMSSMTTKHTSPQHSSDRTSKRSSFRHASETGIRNRDEKRAQTQKIPFSNELIVHLPVEEFNELLENYRLSKEQLALVKDIRRRGKNKIAAQNCRRRKMDTLLGLEEEVSRLRRHRLRLRRENQEALRKLRESKRHLTVLYHSVFSRLKDEEGRPLDATQHVLSFQPNGVRVAARQQEAGLATASKTTSRKQRNKKK
ncbi:endoplasmic reticulum membrane sensor NFE2L1-like [Dunckerocampus dactyliophorus]|uniref:endoplasmic reticulum membrane sensor NFE2L1-like n=1 Tax=Dunckerocampus dactyliophorus TaxID=161453 RepID=UPI0024069488|nr:endoplasmic reticulum membrane sensor NFE2L1-like [Dunckerocampus dactyliophorus]